MKYNSILYVPKTSKFGIDALIVDIDVDTACVLYSDFEESISRLLSEIHPSKYFIVPDFTVNSEDSHKVKYSVYRIKDLIYHFTPFVPVEIEFISTAIIQDGNQTLLDKIFRGNAIIKWDSDTTTDITVLYNKDSNYVVMREEVLTTLKIDELRLIFKSLAVRGIYMFILASGYRPCSDEYGILRGSTLC